jgi:hypothetical protein
MLGDNSVDLVKVLLRCRDTVTALPLPLRIVSSRFTMNHFPLRINQQAVTAQINSLLVI